MLEQKAAVAETGFATSLKPADLTKLHALKEAILHNRTALDLAPFARNQLEFRPSGLEVKRFTTDLLISEGDDYEDKCYRNIASRPGRSLIFGPCLTNTLLNQRFTREGTKPDAIRFEKNQPRHWRLIELYEFKSSLNNFRLTPKLSGFALLLTKLRENPDYLPRLLTQAFHDMRKLMILPETIEVPPNEQIIVTFVCPSKKSSVVKIESGFPIRHMRIKDYLL